MIMVIDFGQLQLVEDCDVLFYEVLQVNQFIGGLVFYFGMWLLLC